MSQRKICFCRAITYTCFLSFTVVVLFALINVAYYYYSKDRRVHGFVASHTLEEFSQVYPGKTKEEINRIFFEFNRPFVYQPFTEISERPTKGKYLNVHKEGFRLVENQGPWPPNPNNFNIFFFGGSTAFGYGVADNETVASQLQSILRSKVGSPSICVYNFGCGYYFSTNEKILFSRILEKEYNPPQLAIFLDGLNDSIQFTKDSGTVISDRIARIINHPTRALFYEIQSSILSLPVVTLIQRIGSRFGRNLFVDLELNKFQGGPAGRELIDLINNWTKNKLMIQEMARPFGTKVLFVWQPVPHYKYDLKYHVLFEYYHNRYLIKTVYEVMNERRRPGLEKEGNFLWLADMCENRKEELFCDGYHYSPAFSKDIATELVKNLISHHFIAGATLRVS